MKKIYTIIAFTLSVFAITSCVKDRLYIPDSNNPNKPIAPLDSTIKLSINEFLASNSTVSVPGNTNFPDWIEIYNSGETDVNLAGYSITDDLNTKERLILGILDEMAKSAGNIFYSKAHSLLSQITQQLEHPIFTNVNGEYLEDKTVALFEQIEIAIKEKKIN